VNPRPHVFNCLTYMSRSHEKSHDRKVVAYTETYLDDNVQVNASLLLQGCEFVFTMQELRITSPSDGPVRKLSRQRSRAGTQCVDEVSWIIYDHTLATHTKSANWKSHFECGGSRLIIFHSISIIYLCITRHSCAMVLNCISLFRWMWCIRKTKHLKGGGFCTRFHT